MATNFNVTGLADFTAADPQKAISLVILEGIGTKDYFNMETGVKYQTKIPYVSSVALDVSTGPIAGYKTGSGSTTVKDITLSNIQYNIFETYTKEVLNKTILASLGTKGTDPSELPMEELILGLKTKQLHVTNEQILWQADPSTVSSVLGTQTGILRQIKDAGPGAIANVAVSFQTYSDASILQHVKQLVNTMETIKPEFVTIPTIMAMSPANFSAWARAQFGLNGVINTQTLGANGQITNEAPITGTSIKVVSMIGLNGKNNIVLTVPENIVVAYDLVDETDNLGFIFNPFARWFELAGQYKLGVKVVDASNCIVSQ